jgi:type I restriction enzyme M protein
MLNSETKRHIDAARDVLVGVAPNPMTQIDQITYALIYKFMDDMDQSAIKAGGEPSFFVGELEQFAWSKLVDTRMGNQEKMNLYGEALSRFAEAKQLPELFRTIFRAAFLPYRSPETLGLFLKEINYFDYTHPEELGNAYEYLLSIMSAQGDAGQFRTPRHIIDFMVAVVNPTKNDKILDPACGTGGFLVSSYNRILAQHDGKDDPKKIEKPLTPDERKKLMGNLEGYDIDPSMVRISQVNMYLHQFKNPKIFQYDTLTSEERWNDKFDVILANPPFMSPKGGIKPHNKFGIQSNRSEVLFVDYIASHLKPNGRAGIIVPEGIIFQSGKAYKELRKNLVEGGLYAVVSLPSGVFQPYSGVKTSILLINSEIAKLRDEILFIKIANDGYDPGATKRPIDKNDLPEAERLLAGWAASGNFDSGLATSVARTSIAENGEFNLSGDRYRANSLPTYSNWPLIQLDELVAIHNGSTPKKSEVSYWESGEIPWFTIEDIRIQGRTIRNTRQKLTKKALQETSVKLLPPESVLLCCTASLGEYAITEISLTTNQQFNGLVVKDKNRLLPKYLFWCVSQFKNELERMSGKSTFGFVSVGSLKKFEIPLPPLEVQKQIVGELDGYAAIIEGAKTIVENWKPRIDVDPEWERRELGDVCEVYQPKTITGTDILEDGPFKVYGANGVIGFYDKFNHPEAEVAVTCRGATCGTINFTEPESWITGNAMVVSPKEKSLSKKFLRYLLTGTDLNPVITGSAQPQITGASLKPFKIPVPPIDVQEEIVREIEFEMEQVDSAKKLVKSYETRTNAVISKLWSVS